MGYRFFLMLVGLFTGLGLMGCGGRNTSSFGTPSATTTQNPFVPAAPSAGEVDTGIYGDSSNPEVKAVTSEYGETIITARTFPITGQAVSKDHKPWSSWWYPKKDNFLFTDTADGKLSPLTKYDYIRRSRNSSAASAVDFERRAYTPQAISWEGLCDAWSIAAIAKPEPQRPVRVALSDDSGDAVTFSIADLKALLLKTYEAVDDSGLKYYGQKFDGDTDGWIYPDIFPDQFHRFIQVQLFDHQRAFVMDHDPSEQVWNVPVYKANYKMDLIPNQPNAVFVRAWLYSAESVQSNEKGFIGTREAVREYDYVLQGDRDAAGNLIVKSGYWVKGPDGIDSRKDHPDYMIQISDPAHLARKSWNPEIDVDLVDEILAKSY